jgi:hypothetical protein
MRVLFLCAAKPCTQAGFALVLVCRTTVKWLAWHKVIIDLGSQPGSFSTIPVFR